MATTPSSFPRIQSSSTRNPVEPDFAVTQVTQRRPPSSQLVSRAFSMSALPKEPEDARLTGGTRSLDRRLLALNLSASKARTRTSADAA